MNAAGNSRLPDPVCSCKLNHRIFMTDDELPLYGGGNIISGKLANRVKLNKCFSDACHKVTVGKC